MGHLADIVAYACKCVVTLLSEKAGTEFLTLNVKHLKEVVLLPHEEASRCNCLTLTINCSIRRILLRIFQIGIPSPLVK